MHFMAHYLNISGMTCWMPMTGSTGIRTIRRFPKRQSVKMIYEGLRLRQPSTQQTVVPDAASRQQAPAAMQPYLEAYPVPNGPELGTGAAEFASAFSDPSSLNATSIRVDHQLNSKWTLFGRYNYSPSSLTQRGPL